MLSPKLSVGTPALSSIFRNRLFSGVSFGKRRCRPPFIWPAPPPATDHRKIVVRVPIAVASAAAVDDDRVVEQIARRRPAWPSACSRRYAKFLTR